MRLEKHMMSRHIEPIGSALGAAVVAAMCLGLGCSGHVPPARRDPSPVVTRAPAEPHDECPSEAEDIDHFRDDDGCPDPDNDGDNIPDAIDKCPGTDDDVATQETYNGLCDDDGCPDKAIDYALDPDMGGHVDFRPGSSLLTAQARGKIDRMHDLGMGFHATFAINAHGGNARLQKAREHAVIAYFTSIGASARSSTDATRNDFCPDHRPSGVDVGIDTLKLPNDCPPGATP